MILTFSDRVWADDPSTISEARARYEQDPEGQLLPFASVLYSFLHRVKYRRQAARDLYALRESLSARARQLPCCPPAPQEAVEERFAAQAEMLATYLHWISRRSPDLGQRERFKNCARRAISEGLGYARGTGQKGHTRALLFLALAAIDLDEGLRLNAGVNLRFAAKLAPGVQNINQRARVYRKLGLLFRRSGAFVEGMRWSIRACRLPGVARGVRKKNLIALCGIGS